MEDLFQLMPVQAKIGDQTKIQPKKIEISPALLPNRQQTRLQ